MGAVTWATSHQIPNGLDRGSVRLVPVDKRDAGKSKQRCRMHVRLPTNRTEPLPFPFKTLTAISSAFSESEIMHGEESIQETRLDIRAGSRAEGPRAQENPCGENSKNVEAL
jgi:hypothetical protein